jgi:hypothetical protein
MIQQKTLTSNQVKPMVGREAFSESMKNFFFPDRENYNNSRTETAIEGLALAHELLLKLANRIEVHADGAPYPHIAQTLRRIAMQKYDSAKKLRTIIESLGEKPKFPGREPRPGRNHWERLNLDLQDQIALDDFLFTLELKAGETPEVSQIVQDLRSSQKSHRQILSDLIAIADPQATQT